MSRSPSAPAGAAWVLLGVVLLGLTGAGPAFAASAWQPIGPFGADVRALAVDPGQPDRVYAATRHSGVFLSEDRGRTWAPRNTGIPKDLAVGYQPLYAVTVDAVGGKVYALGTAVATGGILVSDDAGATWSALQKPAGGTGWYFGLTTDPEDSGKLTVANVAGVFVYDFQAADTVRSWKAATGIASLPLLAMERAPSDPDVFYAVSGNATPNLYRSGDRADTFGAVGPLPGPGFRDLAVSPVNPDWIWVAVAGGVYASQNGGTSWSPVAPAGSQIFLLLFDPETALLSLGRGVCAVGRGGLFADDASSSDLTLRRDFYYTRGSDAAVYPDGSALIATDMGVFAVSSVAQPGEGTVEYLTSGMDEADVTTLVAAGGGSDVVYAGTGVTFDAGIFRSADGGNTWENRSAGLTNLDIRSLAVFAGDPDILYVGTADAIDDTGENGGIWKSTDGGLTWTDLSAGLNHTDPHIIISIVIHPTDPDIVYASVQGLYGGIYKSTDGGATWTRKANGLESMPPIYSGVGDFVNYFAMLSLAMKPGDPKTLWIGAGGCWGGTYYTHDGGDTWVRRADIGTPPPMEPDSKSFGFPPGYFPIHLELFDMDVDPNNTSHLYACGNRAVDGEGSFGIFYQSTDAGLNWTLVREGAKTGDYFTNPISALAMHPSRPGELFVATVDGAETSTDGGATWSAMNDGLPTGKRFARKIAVDPDDPNRLYLATATGGVYVRELAPVAVTLLSFTGDVRSDGGVDLRWAVADETDHLGYDVDREVEGVRTRLTGSFIRDLHFVDPDPVPGTVNRYWLVELDRAGTRTDLGSVDVQVAPGTGVGVPKPGLSAAFPNPFRGGTALRLTARRAGRATVRVFDLAGRPVATLLDGPVAAGERNLGWDGRDDRGIPVRNGIYWIRGDVNGEAFQRRVVVAGP